MTKINIEIEWSCILFTQLIIYSDVDRKRTFVVLFFIFPVCFWRE